MGSTVTYTYVVTNNSDAFTWTGKLTDDKNGSIADPLTLAPGASQTFTASGSITGAVTNTATAAGAFNDPTSTQASAQKSATVTGHACFTSQITPTQTTCQQFAAGTSSTLSTINYSVSGGKVSQNVNPGVFFYWVKVTATAGQKFTINQSITTGNFSTLFTVASGSNAFDVNCNSAGGLFAVVGSTTATFTAPSAGTFYIGIKYNAKAVAGATAPSACGTVHYQFDTNGDAIQGVDLKFSGGTCSAAVQQTAPTFQPPKK